MAKSRYGIYKKCLGFTSKKIAPFIFKNRTPVLTGAGPSATVDCTKPLVWFHAASVGELESMWTVCRETAFEGASIVLTVFSESAGKQVKKLAEEIRGKNGNVLFAGYCPLEGDWAEVISAVRPNVFVSAKYEAWPELWIELADKGIPLVILAARARSSLAVCKKICRFLHKDLPQLHLLLTSTSGNETQAIKNIFPGAALEVTGDPRWDRVFERAKSGSLRATELISKFAGFEKPWGVLGSFWLDDLRIWSENLTKTASFLWIVPHDVDEDNIKRIEHGLRDAGLSPVRTSSLGQNGLKVQDKISCALVDEMGFLSELYSKADWAYVGGGFSKGIHSTIEPAIHGIPVSSGPKSAAKFSEILELSEEGQLQILNSSFDLREWLLSLPSKATRRDVWKRQAEARGHSTDNVMKVIRKLIEIATQP